MTEELQAGGYRAIIGLEIHVQLQTRTKMFCGCRVEFGAPPNTHVCPVCLGLPGALPVPNVHAVRLAIRTALALNASLQRRSVFARKNYFYPDLPRGYQITQYDRPLALGGWMDLPSAENGAAEGGVSEGGVSESAGAVPGNGSGRVRLRRVHLEEDAGKSLHDRFPGLTAIDLNRAGTPLVEIVTEPDLRAPAEARAFLLWLKRTLEYLGVSDCNMEEGSLRVDANVSVRGPESRGTPVRTELKNMNSFGGLERALRFEADRHIRTLESGGRLEAETLTWDEARGVARPMRGKEAEHDYRYFPEPDLPPLDLTDEEIERLRAGLPELPLARWRRLRSECGLPERDAEVLTRDRELADYYERAARESGDPAAASRWVLGPLLALANEQGTSVADLAVPAIALAELIGLTESGALSDGLARRVLRRVAETGERPARIVEREGLRQVGDAERIAGWVRGVLERHPAEAERYRNGETKLLDFFVGQVMRESRGKADPHAVRRALEEEL